MNLVEKLLKADAGKADVLKTKKIKSKKLAEIIQEQEPAEVTVREIPTKRMNDLISIQFDKNGKFNYGKAFDSKAMAVAEGVINPDLKNTELQAHFKCATSKELAIKLFGGEVNSISDVVAELSGIGEVDETDEEIKN